MNAIDANTEAALESLVRVIVSRGPAANIAALSGGAFNVTFEKGRKFLRVVTAYGQHNRSCWGFVDVATGEIFKAASWKAPAKGPRGNLYDLSSYFQRVSASGIA